MSSHVSIKEAAKLAKRSEQTIRRAVKRGDLEAEMVGGRYQVLVSSLSNLYHFDQADKGDHTTSQTANQSDLTEIIAILREQLKSKDDQIARLTQALQAQQMITASLTKHLPTLDAKKETRKASLWSRVRSRLG